MVAVPPNPPEEERGPKLVSPVQFLEQPVPPVLPDGVQHPSTNLTHSFTMADQEVEEVPGEYSEPTEADLEPLLIDNQNGQKANPVET